MEYEKPDREKLGNALDLAVRAYDRMTGSPSMEGRTPVQGSLTMEEHVAFNIVFGYASAFAFSGDEEE